MESGSLILDMQAFDIKALVEEVFEDLEFKANEANIDLIFKSGADHGFMVRADRESQLLEAIEPLVAREVLK